MQNIHPVQGRSGSFLVGDIRGVEYTGEAFRHEDGIGRFEVGQHEEEVQVKVVRWTPRNATAQPSINA